MELEKVMTSTKEAEERYRLVLNMMEPDFDYASLDYAMTFPEVFRECLIERTALPHTEYVPCGSARVDDTPRALYRLLWLMEPHGISFSDMYKSTLMMLWSVDGRFAVDVAFYKYALGLYFYAKRELVFVPSEPGILKVDVGMPGADNGPKLMDDSDGLFFEMVTKVLNHQHSVYPGNNFEV